MLVQVAYYGEPGKSPTIFFKAYIQSTTEEFRKSEEAPKMDAKNPAGWLVELSCLSEMVYKENITCPRVDTNFIFECST